MNPPSFVWNTDAILRGLLAKMLAYLVSGVVLSCLALMILMERYSSQDKIRDMFEGSLPDHPIWVVTGLGCSIWGGIITGRRAPEHELSHALAGGLVAGAMSLLPIIAGFPNTTLVQGMGALITPLAFGIGGWWQKQERKNAPPPGKSQKSRGESQDKVQEVPPSSED